MIETSFNVGEIFEMAVKMERDGGAFYRRSARHVADQKSKDVLLSLAAMEDKHQNYFREMKNEHGDQSMNSAFPDEEAARYLDAWVEGRVFDPEAVEREFDQNESMESIVKSAIWLEKDSISFYLGLLHAVPEDWGREKIDFIIKEEMRHVIMLRNLLVELSGP